MANLDANELNRAHSELKSDARRRIADRGLLQFRADPDTIRAVIDAADKHKLPVRELLRQWVQERLNIETREQQE